MAGITASLIGKWCSQYQNRFTINGTILFFLAPGLYGLFDQLTGLTPVILLAIGMKQLDFESAAVLDCLIHILVKN